MADSLTRLVPIRTVCAMYGLNPNTLRTWERRYGVISPGRSEGGHRGYGEQDLARIEQMVTLLREGMSPAAAAERIRTSLGELTSSGGEDLSQLRLEVREAVQSLNDEAVNRMVTRFAAELGYQSCIENVLFPELVYWGENWERNKSGVLYEHLATLAVVSCINERRRSLTLPATGLPVVLACAPGEEHSLPIQHVSNLLTESREFRPLLLVGGLPVSEVLVAAQTLSAHALVLSATMVPRPDVVRQWMAELSQAGWESRTMLVGGGFSHSRIFSESRVKSAHGSYDQVLKVLRRM